MIFKTSILFSFKSGFGGVGCGVDDGFIKAIYDADSWNVRYGGSANRVVRVIHPIMVDRIFLNGSFLDELSGIVIFFDDGFLHLLLLIIQSAVAEAGILFAELFAHTLGI